MTRLVAIFILYFLGAPGTTPEPLTPSLESLPESDSKQIINLLVKPAFSFSDADYELLAPVQALHVGSNLAIIVGQHQHLFFGSLEAELVLRIPEGNITLWRIPGLELYKSELIQFGTSDKPTCRTGPWIWNDKNELVACQYDRDKIMTGVELRRLLIEWLKIINGDELTNRNFQASI